MFRGSPYPPSALSWFGAQGLLSSQLGISHPSLVAQGPIQDLSPLSDSIEGGRYERHCLLEKVFSSKIEGSRYERQCMIETMSEFTRSVLALRFS